MTSIKKLSFLWINNVHLLSGQRLGLFLLPDCFSVYMQSGMFLLKKYFVFFYILFFKFSYLMEQRTNYLQSELDFCNPSIVMLLLLEAYHSCSIIILLRNAPFSGDLIMCPKNKACFYTSQLIMNKLVLQIFQSNYKPTRI